jgi:DNA-binding response OmpR family regulator
MMGFVVLARQDGPNPAFIFTREDRETAVLLIITTEMNTANYMSPAVSNPLAPSTCSARTGTGKKILIVDDSVVILKALSAKLRANGYQVFTAVDGSEAVSTVRRERPNLILLDINFPPDVAHGGGVPWDGLLIMNWLRRMDEALNTPVIIITGSESASSRSRYLAAGVSGFFLKPLNNEELLGAISKILDAPGEAQPSTKSASAKKVLFVDDETDWRFMASIYLKDSGFDVAVASNGAEGVAKMRELKPDVVLLDLNLAGESGLDVLQLLKAERPDVCVVLYTGMDHDSQSIQAMLRLGAHQYLRKGTMGEMLKAVQSAVADQAKVSSGCGLRLA